MILLYPFDAHNHVHLGLQEKQTLTTASSLPDSLFAESDNRKMPLIQCQGMALMSTHPRDWDTVLSLATATSSPSTSIVVPCLGVHLWFLPDVPVNTDDEWKQRLEELLVLHPNAIVGEIGLDGFHYYYEKEEGESNNQQQRKTVCSMNRQNQVFSWQLELAAKLNRSVSIHVVQAFGPLLECLSAIQRNQERQRSQLLPKRLYFHAFGGKVGTVKQLLALCERSKKKGNCCCCCRVYFGFAPVINFRSPKTKDVIRCVGLDRIVLETDHEDPEQVPSSLVTGIRYLAETLECSYQQVVEQTTKNAADLYGVNLL